MRNYNPKYVLMIDHTTKHLEDNVFGLHHLRLDRGFTNYALKSEDKALALAEAAIKAMKSENVHCWMVYARNGKGNARGAEYAPIVRFFPSGKVDLPGEIDWGYTEGWTEWIYAR